MINLYKSSELPICDVIQPMISLSRLSYLGSLRLLWLDPLDLGVGDVEIRAVLLVPPGHLPQLLLPLFEQVLVEEGAEVGIMILDPFDQFSAAVIGH